MITTNNRIDLIDPDSEECSCVFRHGLLARSYHCRAHPERHSIAGCLWLSGHTLPEDTDSSNVYQRAIDLGWCPADAAELLVDFMATEEG